MRHGARQAAKGGRDNITPTMLEVERRCAAGEKARDVAAALGLAERTAWNYCHRVREARRDAAAEAAGRAVAAR